MIKTGDQPQFQQNKSRTLNLEMAVADFVYLDFQASTPVCEEAWEAMQPYFQREFSNPHSTQHLGGISSSQAIENARSQVAKLINADTSEMVFTSGATEANNLVFLGLLDELRGKRILVSAIEHKSVLAPAEHLGRYGIEVELIPVTGDGMVDVETLETMMGDDVGLVSIMMANNEVGSVNPIKDCVEIVRKYGAYFHTDAAQAPLTGEVDVLSLDVDFLSLSSHKIYGPKGVGALYVSNFVQDKLQPILFGGGQERGWRPGTLPTALCVGFGAAAQTLQNNKRDIWGEIRGFRDYFWEKLRDSSVDTVLIGPDFNTRHVGNLNVCFIGMDAEELLLVLQQDVAASTGSACNSGLVASSHVLSALHLNDAFAKGCIRFSFGLGLTYEDLDVAVLKVMRSVMLLS
ncbi:cysteine desulfurase family protein [Emcibacter sp.]|uniref:cysteine desulfurase family protein n=1 Tax=Emcibacter sp. TaxID=1979954 RepID=UPI002AA66218|nr:cysteine desulfurase family protein [Emcibacter sp.]